MKGRIPYLPIVVAACTVAVTGYGVFSWWVVFVSGDVAMIGDVIGTWKSFAVLAFGFWLGSSSGGKAEDQGAAKVEVMNKPDNPVPVEADDYAAR